MSFQEANTFSTMDNYDTSNIIENDTTMNNNHNNNGPFIENNNNNNKDIPNTNPVTDKLDSQSIQSIDRSTITSVNTSRTDNIPVVDDTRKDNDELGNANMNTDDISDPSNKSQISSIKDYTIHSSIPINNNSINESLLPASTGFINSNNDNKEETGQNVGNHIESKDLPSTIQTNEQDNRSTDNVNNTTSLESSTANNVSIIQNMAVNNDNMIFKDTTSKDGNKDNVDSQLKEEESVYDDNNTKSNNSGEMDINPDVKIKQEITVSVDNNGGNNTNIVDIAKGDNQNKVNEKENVLEKAKQPQELNNNNKEEEEKDNDNDDDDDDDENVSNNYVGTPILEEDDKNGINNSHERISNNRNNSTDMNSGTDAQTDNNKANDDNHVHTISKQTTDNTDITMPSSSNNNKITKQKPKLAFPQIHEIIIPNYASWLNLKKIHKIEIKSLPEWFTNRIPSKTPEIYVKCRNFMINSYRLNPNEYFSVTAARRNLSGDAAALFRLHKFLMKWGLINYQVDPELLPKTIQPPLTAQNSAKHDAPRGYFPFESYKPSVQLPDMSKLKKMMDVSDPKSTLSNYLAEQKKRSIHNVVKKEEKPQEAENLSTNNTTDDMKNISKTESEVNNIELHPAKRPKILDALDETDIESNVKWGKDEIIRLVEGLQKFNTDWYEVAKFVGTKTPEQCILQFLQLPIEDNYLYQQAKENGVGIGPLKYSPHLPFSKNDNPVLSTIAYLVGLVDPVIVKKLTNRALTEFHKLTEEKDDKEMKTNHSPIATTEQSTFIDPSKNLNGLTDPSESPKTDINNKDVHLEDGLKEGSELALATFGLRSHIFASNEERKLNQITNKLLEVQLSKINIKLEKFSKLEKNLELEKKILQRRQEEFLLEKLSFNKNAFLLLNKLESAAKRLNTTGNIDLQEDIDQLKEMLKNPLSISFSSSRKSKSVSSDTNKTNNENDDKSDEIKSTIKPVSLDTPQMYRYWSG